MAFNPYSLDDINVSPATAGAHPLHFGSLGFHHHHPTMHQDPGNLQPDAMANASTDDVRTTTVPTLANQNGRAAKEDWEKHRELIKRLYLNENNSLAKIMRFMDSQHAFRATPRMYKSHIKQWGLEKNNKEFEMRAIVRKSKARADQGKGSIIRIRGRTLDFAAVARYWNRKGVSTEEVIARRTASPTPEAVEVSTPICSPVLTPQDLAIPERILRCIADYFEGSFGSGMWVGTSPASFHYSIKERHSESDLINQLVCQCVLACRLCSRGSYQEAGQTLIAATAGIKEILLTEPPHTLIYLCDFIISVRRQKRDEIARAILRQFSALGQLLLGSQHPIGRICAWLNSVPSIDIDDVISKCMKSMVDYFERFAGPMHCSTLKSRLKFIEAVGEGAYSRLHMLRNLLGECAKTLGPHGGRSLRVHRHLAMELLREGFYVEAERSSQEIISISQHLQSPRTRMSYQSKGLQLMARCQYALGEVVLGLSNLQKAIDLRLSQVNPRDGPARFWLVVLEDWCTELGQLGAAAQARERRERILESLDKD